VTARLMADSNMANDYTKIGHMAYFSKYAAGSS